MFPIELLVPVVAIGGALLLILLFKRFIKPPAMGAPLQAKPILTPNELAFIEKLSEAVSAFEDIHIFPQVSFQAFLQVAPSTPKTIRQATRNRISQKHCDFALVDSSSNVRLLVELDDTSHRGRERADAARDTLPAAAGIATLRIHSHRVLTVPALEAIIRPYLSPPAAEIA
ncbi:DUF2726 domain-containing protein [Sphingosinicella sp. BN140058]|uniref:DUF2726 domain-containing protein n=1 Tax=Sphingosinicella sp. BN140058 TaxID=1892855 RepID=UPI0013EA5EA4|nr:DUF2726 domain-containing protein [Sphingosinicella sp. BN140058]